jgi:SAM-dependent methyltransferase
VSYLTVAGHRSMALDARRNAAYHAALAGVINPDSAVLDLGAGTGVHGLMAARLGARRVYLVEPEDIISVASEIAHANGLDRIVRCIQGRIEDVELPEPVDVIVSVLTGNFLLTEDLLPALLCARKKTLKPGGCLIPSAGTMEAVPVCAPEVHATEVGSWSQPQHGVDLSVARGYAANTVFYRGRELRGLTRLAEPRTLHRLDFSRDDYASIRIDATFEISQSGVCHGVIGWMNVRLGETWLSTSPDDPAVHWSTAFLPLDPPMAVERGERLSFTLDRAPFGDWTWSVSSMSGRQQHSTMLSAPIAAASLEKARVSYVPALNVEGRLLRQVLEECGSGRAVGDIAVQLRREHPVRFATDAGATAFVQRIVKKYG